MNEADFNADLKVIQSVLNTQFGRDVSSPTKGGIKAVPKNVIEAGQAWNEFVQFGGAGWLENALTPQILHGEANALTTALATVAEDKRWPVAGERVNGNQSLHLRRTAKGWQLVTLVDDLETKALADGSAKAFRMKQRLLSADLKQALMYHVAYTLQDVGTHQEWRPSTSRFVGFEPAKSKD